MRYTLLATVIGLFIYSLAPSASAQTVLQWNLHNDCEFDPTCRQNEVNFIAGLNPRPSILLVQEMGASDVNTWLNALQTATGQTWRAVFTAHRDKNNCNVDFGEGVAILTTWNILSQEQRTFPYPDQWVCARAAARAELNVNGTSIQVFTAHMSTQDPVGNTQAVRDWAAGYSKPQLLGCDCNTEAAPTHMKTKFLDAWPVSGSGAGLTFPAGSATERIDFIFSNAADELWPAAADIPNTTLSDHYPVRVTYRPNLLANGGFESDTPPGLGFPGWTSDRATAAFSETNQPRTGPQNGACWQTNGTDCGMYQELAAQTAGTYTYTVFAAADQAGGLVGANVTHAGSTTVYSRNVNVTPFGVYARYSMSFAVQQGDTIRVWMYSAAIPGSPGHYTVIDDAALTTP